jgi:hypothetical protein
VQHSVASHFFQPLIDLLPRLLTTRICPETTDEAFFRVGVSRVLSQAKSGRDFLQSHAEAGGERIKVSNFFTMIKSERRLETCTEANKLLCAVVGTRCADPFAAITELAEFDLFAGDGHYIKASAHEERIDGDKQPVGNFFIFDLRSRALQHFELGLSDKATNRKREHDMHAIKRHGLADLRFGAKKGRKVMIVWDKAGIDFSHWSKAKESGVYFLSREKENMRLEATQSLPFDKSDPRNEGVISDEMVTSPQGFILRRVVYHDLVNSIDYTYLTTNLRLPPGVLVLLYKRRWDIEKAFDESENRFQENQAWGKSQAAKRIQAEFVCITHNLVLLVEERLERCEQIRNQPEIDRRAQRKAILEQTLASKQQKLPYVYWIIDRITQRGVKLIRWVRNHLYHLRHWEEAIAMLRIAYARL